MSARVPNLSSRYLRSVIIKRKHIYAIEQRDMKIECLKLFYPKFKDTITKLEFYDDTIIDDLHTLSLYKSVNTHNNSFIQPASKVYVGKVIDKYIDEFQKDRDVLEFFTHILHQYKCI
jgi:hypothetical protein